MAFPTENTTPLGPMFDWEHADVANSIHLSSSVVATEPKQPQHHQHEPHQLPTRRRRAVHFDECQNLYYVNRRHRAGECCSSCWYSPTEIQQFHRHHHHSRTSSFLFRTSAVHHHHNNHLQSKKWTAQRVQRSARHQALMACVAAFRTASAKEINNNNNCNNHRYEILVEQLRIQCEQISLPSRVLAEETGKALHESCLLGSSAVDPAAAAASSPQQQQEQSCPPPPKKCSRSVSWQSKLLPHFCSAVRTLPQQQQRPLSLRRSASTDSQPSCSCRNPTALRHALAA